MHTAAALRISSVYVLCSTDHWTMGHEGFPNHNAFQNILKCRAHPAKRQTRESYFYLLSAFHSLERKSLSLSLLLTNIEKLYVKLMDVKACLPLKCSNKFFDLSCTLSLAFNEGSCPGTENIRNNVYMILHIKQYKSMKMHPNQNSKNIMEDF